MQNNGKKKHFLIGIFFIYFISVTAQNKEVSLEILRQYQDSLKVVQHLIFKGKTDAEKYKANNTFLRLFENALNTENSFDFNFDSLTTIGRITSPDKTFKIYNWNLPKTDGTYEYFGFIQAYNRKTKKHNNYKLLDKSDGVRNAENYISDNSKWYGMLYYKVILKKYKKKTYYTLLAWDGNDKLSSKKFIDVLTFASNGTPQFGNAIFEMGKKAPKRIAFEHSAELVMSLKYDDEKGIIIFDHLAPPNKGLDGHYEFYGPDFSYDAFEFKKGKWLYIQDVDARNKKNKNDQFYKAPDTPSKEEIKKQ